MKAFSTTIDIDAPPETVWAILTDASHYADWDPNMISLDGKIAPGETLTIKTRLDPNRAFTPRVVDFVPHQRMVWKSGMPLGLFTGERTFTLDALDGGRTRFAMREAFTGPMMRLIGGSIPDMTAVFDDFGKALKAQAEARG